NHRIKSARTADGKPVPGFDVLEREMSTFRIKTTAAGNQVFGAEASDHDDCVISVALPVFMGNLRFLAPTDPDDWPEDACSVDLSAPDLWDLKPEGRYCTEDNYQMVGTRALLPPEMVLHCTICDRYRLDGDHKTIEGGDDQAVIDQLKQRADMLAKVRSAHDP